VCLVALLILGTLAGTSMADCNPLGIWNGTFTIDGEPTWSGTITNWILRGDGTTEGQWKINTTDLGVISFDPCGTYTHSDCNLVFSCEGTATESEYDTNSPYTLNVTGAIDGNPATGEYNIEFHSALWQSSGYHIFSGDWIVTLTGDFEPDGDVDFVDFTFFAARWRDSNCGDSNDCDGTDFDYSGTVDWSDLGVFTQNWLKGVSGIEYEISPCNMNSSAAERSGQTRFSVTVQGSYIHFEDMMVANCCPDELELQMTVDANLITIYEIEYLSYPCTCICDYPVTATLGPFEPGTYTLEVYEDFGGFIGSTTVTIGP